MANKEIKAVIDKMIAEEDKRIAEAKDKKSKAGWQRPAKGAMGTFTKSAK